MDPCDGCPIVGRECQGQRHRALCQGLQPPRPEPAEVTRARMKVYARILRCPYLDPHCGCDLPTCAAGKGDHDDGARTSFANCARCFYLPS